MQHLPDGWHNSLHDHHLPLSLISPTPILAVIISSAGPATLFPRSDILKLYMSVNSPFARIVRVLAREIGLEGLSEVPTDPRDRGTGFWALNPIGKIPALELENGVVIAESDLICRHIDGLAGGGRGYAALASDPARLALYGTARGALDRGISARGEKLRSGGPDHQKFIDVQLAGVLRGCDALDRAAPEAMKTPDILDITVACALDWLDFRHPEIEVRTGRPRLAAWAEAMSARPSMIETRPD